MAPSVSSTPVNLKKIKINDPFWSGYLKLVREVVIPYQWEALNDRIPDAEPSHAIKNFRIAAGEESGEFGGLVFQDSDLAKWLEAVSFSLAVHPDPALEQLVDEAIDLIEKSQQPDGYINTYYTIKEPGRRWTNLWECHELYCAGHMIEAAAAYYQATGKRKFLDIVCRFADHIDSVFGPEPEKLKGYCGHQEIELALVKLYRVTGEKRYLDLAQYFIDERGKEPYYFDIEWEKRGKGSYWHPHNPDTPPGKNRLHNQTHLPVREQSTAVGHAVRAMYMYTGMAEIAGQTGEIELICACRRLWHDVATRQMYITGGIGSMAYDEAFSFDFDLPNDLAYAETCASIGLIFFSYGMLKLEARSCYADVMERALYNIIIASMSLDGKHFFYVNPLEVWPEACEKNRNKKHIKITRQKWFGCACCPPNLARLLSSLGQYIYTMNENTIYTHLYIGGEADLTVCDTEVKIRVKTNYPWEGRVIFEIEPDEAKDFTIALRIPGWCRKVKIKINNKPAQYNVVDGYAMLRKKWSPGDTIILELAMPVEMIKANPLVRANAGKVAIQRGPLVYCLEEIDNGANLSAISIRSGCKPAVEYEPGLLGGVMTIRGKAVRSEDKDWQDILYRPGKIKRKNITFKALPYFLWGNRGVGEMAVWVNEG